jgi:DNA-binding PadR family transcriptional regulator
MFPDLTLTPKESVRLCALALVAEQERRYSDLAGRTRQFITRLMGPSLDLMGSSIELLRYEGLVEAVDGKGMEDDARLAITDSGRKELTGLLTARLRSGSDLTKLVVALKLRFLHLLPVTEQAEQAAILSDAVATERARLLDLKRQESENGTSAHLLSWLDLEITQAEARMTWLEELSKSLTPAS